MSERIDVEESHLEGASRVTCFLLGMEYAEARRDMASGEGRILLRAANVERVRALALRRGLIVAAVMDWDDGWFVLVLDRP